MGREQLQALAKIIEAEAAKGPGNVVSGTWTIRYDGERGAFTFDKCEDGFYCAERPAVVSVEGEILDPGGPLFEEQAN